MFGHFYSHVPSVQLLNYNTLVFFSLRLQAAPFPSSLILDYVAEWEKKGCSCVFSHMQINVFKPLVLETNSLRSVLNCSNFPLNKNMTTLFIYFSGLLVYSFIPLFFLPSSYPACLLSVQPLFQASPCRALTHSCMLTLAAVSLFCLWPSSSSIKLGWIFFIFFKRGGFAEGHVGWRVVRAYFTCQATVRN